MLRAMEPYDLDNLYMWENDPENWFVSQTRAPYSKHVLSQFIDESHKDIYEIRQLRLMITLKDTGTLKDTATLKDADTLKDPGTLKYHGRPAPQVAGTNENLTVGAIDLFDFEPYHRRAGIGILVARKEVRRQGIASEALALLIDYSFRVLGLHQLYCNVAKGNEASCNLFMKSGFRITGEKKDWLKGDGSWITEYLLQLINDRE
jgi:diamine N-acetyltransferase